MSGFVSLPPKPYNFDSLPFVEQFTICTNAIADMVRRHKLKYPKERNVDKQALTSRYNARLMEQWDVKFNMVPNRRRLSTDAPSPRTSEELPTRKKKRQNAVSSTKRAPPKRRAVELPTIDVPRKDILMPMPTPRRANDATPARAAVSSAPSKAQQSSVIRQVIDLSSEDESDQPPVTGNDDNDDDEDYQDVQRSTGNDTDYDEFLDDNDVDSDDQLSNNNNNNAGAVVKQSASSLPAVNATATTKPPPPPAKEQQPPPPPSLAVSQPKPSEPKHAIESLADIDVGEPDDWDGYVPQTAWITPIQPTPVAITTNGWYRTVDINGRQTFTFPVGNGWRAYVSSMDGTPYFVHDITRQSTFSLAKHSRTAQPSEPIVPDTNAAQPPTTAVDVELAALRAMVARRDKHIRKLQEQISTLLRKQQTAQAQASQARQTQAAAGHQ
jgi:hypothetical protein